jgi:hypothetical protein
MNAATAQEIARWEAEEKMMTAGGCVACGGQLVELPANTRHKRAVSKSFAFMQCAACGGLHADCVWGGDASAVVGRELSPEPFGDDVAYFDFKIVGGAGVTRRHGWYNVKTGKLVQEG